MTLPTATRSQSTETWEKALDEYRYPADLTLFRDAGKYQSWFNWDINLGNRSQTMEFEARFKAQAIHHLEAWAEVMFWKLYTTGERARNERTLHLLHSRISPGELWSACKDYIESPGVETFRVFRNKLFRSPVVATAATFPAFICPEKFPMVDMQVIKWARKYGDRHRYSGVGGPNLADVPALERNGNLQESHWSFIGSWIDWCRFTARRLNELTERAWRARDVEMAVFTAQRFKLPLQPLT